MKNPYSGNENPLLALWAIGMIAKEASFGLGEELAEGVRRPRKALGRRAREWRSIPVELADEFNDRLVSNGAYRFLQHRLADRVGEWLGPEERRRVDALLGGSLADRRKELARLTEDLRESLEQAGQSWRRQVDDRAERFFRMLGTGLDRQVRTANAYKKLGLRPGVSLDAVKEKHRKLSIRYHPDKPSGHLRKMQEINEAYTVLMKFEFGKSGRREDFE